MKVEDENERNLWFDFSYWFIDNSNIIIFRISNTLNYGNRDTH